MLSSKLFWKWIEALESDRFQQGKRFLCVNDHYCCLGVLCEVAGLEKNVSTDTGRVEYGRDGLDRMLKVGRWGDDGKPATFVLMEWWEEMIPAAVGYALTNMNDDQGKTFKEIAAYLRDRQDELCAVE